MNELQKTAKNVHDRPDNLSLLGFNQPGSLAVPFYNSQGYGGGILTHLQMGQHDRIHYKKKNSYVLQNCDNYNNFIKAKYTRYINVCNHLPLGCAGGVASAHSQSNTWCLP
jgi:hypothetical protein